MVYYIKYNYSGVTMKKILCFIVITVLSLSSMTACEKYTSESSKTDFAFDTIVTVSFFSEDGQSADQAVSACFERIKELELIFSATDLNSELYKLNASAYNNPVTASDELFGCIKKTLEYRQMTDNSLDISIGGLIELWGVGTDKAAVPERTKIDDLLGVSCENIVLDAENQTVKFTDSRVKINLGAVAKGYAAGELLKIAEKYEVYGIIDLGGSITVVGSKPDGAFTVGITDPFDTEQLIGTVEFADRTVSTSGDYQRYFTENNIQYHHILDRTTGYPAESDITGVTVICAEPLLADFLSTTVFIMGSEKGLELMNQVDGAEAIIVKTDGEILLSDGADHYYNFTQNF